MHNKPDLVVACFANNYNWPVKLYINDFNELFEWTDDYIHGVVSSACMTQHMVHVRERSDIIIKNFDEVRSALIVARVTNALTR